MTPLSSVVTRITLEKATSREGKPCALFHFDAVQTLDQGTAAKALSLIHIWNLWCGRNSPSGRESR